MSGRVMFSVAAESYGSAVSELRNEFGSDLAVERLGPDLGLVQNTALTVNALNTTCLQRPLVFIRHLTAELIRIPQDQSDNLDDVAATITDTALTHHTGSEIAVQVWTTGTPKTDYSSRDLYEKIADRFHRAGVTVTRSGQERVLSCVITTKKGIVAGLNSTKDSLADWPGGRVRLARHPESVSRAEFKLEELFQLFPLSFSAGGRAVDLGASPGGWTRILRQNNLVVWAIDPGDLDPSLTADSKIHHVRTTAGEFFRLNHKPFDVIVNDMRMDPMISSRTMLDAAKQLKPAGLAVVTLKTGNHRAVETVQNCLNLLRQKYRIVFARQLHHNRNEVTVVARRIG